MTTPSSTVSTAKWVRCAQCAAITYGKRLARNLGVCLDCGHHGPVTAWERVAQLLDEGSAVAVDVAPVQVDPIRFVDVIPYPERLAAARSRTGLDDAAITVRGTVGGHAAVVVVMDFRFLGGSLGAQVGEAVTAAAELARRARTPLIVFAASGGARMQEGAIALMQMARTAQAFAELDEAGVLTVSVITDPTYGGVAASFASLADVLIVEPGARMGFAGPRVIEQTIREQLPSGFQSAEFLLEHGLADAIVPRSTIRDVLIRFLASVGAPPALSRCGEGDEGAVWVENPDSLPARDPWSVVRLARDVGRPTTTDYAQLLLEDFQELKGDRISGDSRAIVGGIGTLGGVPLVLVGHQKGHTTRELVSHNFGMSAPDGYRKAARLMRLAEKLGLPVITLVDTPGAYPGVRAEENGQALAIAESQRLMSMLRVPVIAVVTGEGGSGGALALAVGNIVLMLANAWYSVISPEGCAAILWKTKAEAQRAAKALHLEAAELLRLGVVDGVVPEPDGGAQADPVEAAQMLRNALTTALARMTLLSGDDLVRHRRDRFRRFGALAAGRSGDEHR